MPAKIIEAPVGQTQALSTTSVTETGLEVSAPQLKRDLDASLKLWLHADQKEWQALLERAACLWNIKTHKLHDAEDLPFEEIYTKLGQSKTSAYRFVQIGQRMFEASRELLGEDVDPLTFKFTSKGIARAFEGIYSNGHPISLRGLYQAAQSLEQFKRYLGGERVTEENAVKALEAANVTSESHEEKKAQKALTDKEQERDFHQRMKGIAEARGLKWDRKQMKFVNEDGTDLTEEQEVEFETPDTGIYVWSQFARELSQTGKKLAVHAEKYGKSFFLYSRVPNTRFRQNVEQLRSTIKNQIDGLHQMLDALTEHDLDKIMDIAREGVED